MADASLTSEPEKLLPETQLGHVIGACSEDDGVPDIGVSIGLGEGSMLWLGELLKRDGGDIGFVFHGPNGQRHVAPIWPACEWQEVADLLRRHVAPILARLSSPVSGTDMVMVPREPTEAMCAAFTHMALRSSVAGVGGWHGYAREQWATMLSAAPAAPIPMIAEAGEREWQERLDWDGTAQQAQAAYDALSTPATLDNTAVEGQDEPLNRTDLYRFMDTLKLSEKREVAAAIGFDAAYVAGESDLDRWKRMWTWAADNDKKLALAKAIRRLSTSTDKGVTHVE